MAHGRYHPQPGDLIEISRSPYQHWALYVGDEYVIHVTVSLKEAKVKKELLKKVVGNNKWRVNNKYDRSCTPRPVEEIIQDAEWWIDKDVPHDMLGNNCEHFMTELRYGKGVSRRAKKAVAFVAGVAAVGGVILATISPPGVVGGVIFGLCSAAAVKRLSR